jgi:ribosome maturation factor RimP
VVGGRCLDVTWFLTTCLVTIDDAAMPGRDYLKSWGPQIDVRAPAMPMYYDPTDPDPEPIMGDEEQIMYVRETPEQAAEDAAKKRDMYAPKDDDDDPNEPHAPVDPGVGVSLYVDVETRGDFAGSVWRAVELRDMESPQPVDLSTTVHVDTAALSTMAGAVLAALEDCEDELRVLERHEVVLAGRGPPDVLETQRQFDAHRDKPVMVETVDPFGSNRTLKGTLVDRNAMDVIINKQGRMVTIPLNFVKCVRIPNQKSKLVEQEDLGLE